MKTISFFSEKGGVGKSSFSILYASWLRYQHGLSVGLADFNARISSYRRQEMKEREKLIRSNPDADIRQYDEKKAWPILNCTFEEMERCRKEYSTEIPNSAWLREQIIDGPFQDMDVVICDFPGSLSGQEYIEVASSRLLSLVVIPTEKEPQTLDATITLSRMNGKMNQPYVIFLNRANLGLRNIRDKYYNLVPLLAKQNYPILPDIVVNSERMGTIDKVDIIRSTFRYPDFSSKEFEGARDMGIENLFIDITRILGGRPDIAGTAETDLSFVKALHKKDDGRQAKGSAFPQLEIR